MPNKIVQLVDNENNNIYPVAGSLAQDSVTTSTINDEAVTSSKIDFSTMPGNYSTSEIDTGYTWIDGSHIYKKTLYEASIPVGSPSEIPHNISNINLCIKTEIFEIAAPNTTLQIPALVGTNNSNYVSTWTINSTKVQIYTAIALTDVYITLYYTKTS